MKLSLFSLLFLLVFNQNNAQTVLLNEDFESYPNFTITNFGQWGLLDLDQLNTTTTIGGDPAPPVNWASTWPNAGAKMAYQIFNFSQSNATNDFTGATGDIRNFNPRSGQKYAACWAGNMVQSFQGNNDWLITPSVALGSTGNQISMYLKTLSSSYGDEKFQIGVYTGTGNPAASTDFTIINILPYQQVSQNLNIDNNWRNFVYNLDAYSGQTIRIGIHCITEEASALLVDDVKITTTGSTLSASESPLINEVIVYPNPIKDVLSITADKMIPPVQIYSREGKLIKVSYSKTINISEFVPGNYFLKIFLTDSKQIIKQIIKN
ncbi:T9SS-dependent choice-of-anchor J family protein [Chryseobacterium sp. BLS98]|uniref:T9SS-dependent choice-of-anchor J family protein n=1 Tax=Chryseobacterium sp. BLS98 TaxID=885586 RepID=UPI000A019CAE|nr:choice-of-anchor J domain-containing protein [Chryseobacterium sp. BLS98]